MSDQHDDTVTESVEISVYPEDAAEKALLPQMVAGVRPFMLITPRPHDQEENHLVWNFLGSCVDDPADLLEHLEWAVDNLREAIEQQAAIDDGAEGIEDADVVEDQS